MGRTSRNSWSNSRHRDHRDLIPGCQRKTQLQKRDPPIRPSCVANARRTILQPSRNARPLLAQRAFAHEECEMPARCQRRLYVALAGGYERRCREDLGRRRDHVAGAREQDSGQ
jgi:hypothetical protein